MRSKALVRQFCTLVLGRTFTLESGATCRAQMSLCMDDFCRDTWSLLPSRLRIDEEIAELQCELKMRSEKGPTPVPIILGRNGDFSTIFVILKSTFMYSCGSHLFLMTGCHVIG